MIRKKSELKPEIRIGMKGGPGQVEVTELVQIIQVHRRV